MAAFSGSRAIAHNFLVMSLIGFASLGLVNGMGATAGVNAQIIPDATLGAESSRVRRTRIPRREGAGASRQVQRIDGGAIRGESLFHSFSEFNIGTEEAAYFRNPAGIETILGRVTGRDVSDIFGTLGVLGEADLFLINPNGFMFGETATLDLRGSFVASTAERFDFPDGSHFSAVRPNAAPLLTVALTPGLQYGHGFVGDVDNRADLAVEAGQMLAIAGRITRHSGSLTAPDGTVQIFGHHILLAGAAAVDVSAESGGGSVYIGGERRGQGALPTAQTVRVGPGVAIAANGLTSGSGGEIVVWGDRSTTFLGRVEARGGAQGGNGGFVEVSGRQRLHFDGSADLSAPAGSLGTLLLDPENIVIVDGDGGANDGNLTDDDQVQVGNSPAATFTISETTLETLSGDANIVLEASNDITLNDLSDNELLLAIGDGTVTFTADADADGSGNFTMLDRQDRILTGGRDITITGAVLTPGNIATEGGNVILAASDRLVLDNVTLNSGDFEGVSFTGVAGDVELSAVNDVVLRNSRITSEGGTLDADEAGSIRLRARDGSILLDDSELSSTIFSNGRAGDIELEAGDRLTIRNSVLTSDVLSDFQGVGGAGFIQLTATNGITLTANSTVSAASFGAVERSGNALDDGNIIMTSETGNIDVRQSTINTTAEGSGFAGNITLQALAGAIAISNDSTITSDLANDLEISGLSADGGAGAISLNARRDVAIADSLLGASGFGVGNTSDGGSISVRSESGDVELRSATLDTAIEGSGFAGDIIISARRGAIRIETGRISSDVNSDGFSGSGGAGFIQLNARDSIQILADSDISAGSFDVSDFDATLNDGNVAIRSRRGSIRIDDSDVSTDARGDSFAGRVNIVARNNIRILNDSEIRSNAQQGLAGTLNLRVRRGTLLVDDSRISNASAGSRLERGERDQFPLIELRSRRGDLILRNSTHLVSTANAAGGRAANTELLAGGAIVIDNSRILNNAEGRSGRGGRIGLRAERIEITNDSRLRSDASGVRGDGGDIGVNAASTLWVRDSVLRSNASNPEESGSAGQIRLSGPLQVAIVNSSIDSDSRSLENNADAIGIISIEANQGLVILDNSSITTTNRGPNLAGDIEVDAQDLILISNGSQVQSEGVEGLILIGQRLAPLELVVIDSDISTTNEPFPVEDAGSVALAADDIQLVNSLITTNTFGDGLGGEISLIGQDAIILDASQIVSEVSEFTQDEEGFEIQAIGNGGDIEIFLPVSQGVLILENGSRISTNARNFVSDRQGGNGGNILIEANFVTADRLGNNDITANAFVGEGGEISITAPDGIVGLVELSREDLILALGTSEPSQLDPINLESSDITAISQTGNDLSGEVIVASPDTDPSRGLTELPTVFEETPTLTSACGVFGRGGTGDRSEFVVTGRDALPLQPSDSDSFSELRVPWVIRHETSSEGDQSGLPQSQPGAEEDKNGGDRDRAVIEAQGWYHNEQGQVVLVSGEPGPGAQQTLATPPPAPSNIPWRLQPQCVSLASP